MTVEDVGVHLDPNSFQISEDSDKCEENQNTIKINNKIFEENFSEVDIDSSTHREGEFRLIIEKKLKQLGYVSDIPIEVEKLLELSAFSLVLGRHFKSGNVNQSIWTILCIDFDLINNKEILTKNTKIFSQNQEILVPYNQSSAIQKNLNKKKIEIDFHHIILTKSQNIHKNKDILSISTESLKNHTFKTSLNIFPTYLNYIRIRNQAYLSSMNRIYTQLKKTKGKQHLYQTFSNSLIIFSLITFGLFFLSLFGINNLWLLWILSLSSLPFLFLSRNLQKTFHDYILKSYGTFLYPKLSLQKTILSEMKNSNLKKIYSACISENSAINSIELSNLEPEMKFTVNTKKDGKNHRQLIFKKFQIQIQRIKKRIKSKIPKMAQKLKPNQEKTRIIEEFFNQIN